MDLRLFGEAHDPDPFLPRVLREDEAGWLVEKEGEVVYIQRGLGGPLDGWLGDAGTWFGWQQTFRTPHLAEPPAIMRTAFGTLGGRKVYGITSLLTFMLDDVVRILGTEDEGINMQLDGEDVFTGGTATITLMLDGVVIV